ncbi:unnamed protein product [Dicrocoelium dendriticum]|nr:unnamed protein product [Dicrocoelium dendriticum]
MHDKHHHFHFSLSNIAAEVDLVAAEPGWGNWYFCDDLDAACLSLPAITHRLSRSAEDNEPDQTPCPDEEDKVFYDVEDGNELEDRANGSLMKLLSCNKRRQSLSTRQLQDFAK